MTKNIIVTDEKGQQIGLTYPKRARGLVKNGRAEYTSDCSVKMLDTHVPTSDNMEVINMSNVINFNARDFHFNTLCESNAGAKMFITDESGRNVECFTIGDWKWSWTEIMSTKKLGANTEGVFRFELHGGYNSTNDATSRFSVIVHKDEMPTEAEKADGCVYKIDKSSYKPLFSKKKPDGGLLRVYEIPFSTGECEYVTFVFTAMHAEQTMFPAKDNESYADMDDMAYEQLYFRQADRCCSTDGSSIDMSDTEVNEKEFADMLASIGDGCNAAFNCGTVTRSEGLGYMYIGCSSDGSNMDFSGSTLTMKAFSMIIAKIGDGCNVCLDCCTITDKNTEGLYDRDITSCDGTNISLDALTLPDGMLAEVSRLVRMKSGDGCSVSMKNVHTLSDADSVNI